MYQVLYRKWRPKTFDDVYGQPQVTTTLTNELKEGRLSHAYLFTGSRGTGKTSCAKILAKAVNCLNPKDGNPCNECEICRSIDNGSCLDVIEIDAASNNGVDNIRDLRDEANFTPSMAKYRVYIIDEVHMLSISAFNALLKTLEEPPEHVKFILATTEVHKLPSTILSRCQRFDFKHITPEDISRRLKYVSEQENIALTDGGAMLISRLADGAMRDALSILDRCVSYNAEITEEIVADAAGIAGREYLFSLADCIANRDTVTALETVDTLHKNSCDMERLITELTNHFRNLLVVKTVKNYKDLIICPDDEMQKLLSQSGNFRIETILYVIDKLNEALGNIKKSVNRRIETETVLVSLCSPELDQSYGALLERISSLEAQIRILKNSDAVQRNSVIKTPSVPTEKPKEEKPRDEIREKTEKYEPNEETPSINIEPEQPIETEEKEPEQETEQNAVQADVPFDLWPDAVKEISKTDAPLSGFLTDTSAVIHGNLVLIKTANPMLDTFLRKDNHASAIRNAILKVTGKKYQLGIFNTPKTAPAEKKDPLDGFLEKAQSIGLDVERKE